MWYDSGYRWGVKPTDADSLRLPISRFNMKRDIHCSGILEWRNSNAVISSVRYEIDTRSHTQWIHLHYACGDTREERDDTIHLTTTTPNYGGHRWWFSCPACGHRVGVLFLLNVLACRHCCNIAYTSQREPLCDRLLSKAQKIHYQLGGNWQEDSSTPPKPKGMHWKTYSRKVLQMENAFNASLSLF